MWSETRWFISKIREQHPQLQMFASCTRHGVNCTCECVCIPVCLETHACSHSGAGNLESHCANDLSYTNKTQIYKDIFMGLLLYFSSEYFLFIIKNPQMTACQETFGAHMSMVNGHNKSLLYLELGYHHVCIEECRKDWCIWEMCENDFLESAYNGKNCSKD